MPTNPRVAILRKVYESFNSLDRDAILSAFAEDVEWRDQLDGTWITGKPAIAAYWASLAELIRTEVAVKSMRTLTDGRVQVQGQQTVRNTEGHIWSTQMVNHSFSFDADNKITRMEPEDLD